MTSEGRKRKRSESLDAALSPAQLSTAQPEHPEQPERAEQPGYTDFDRAATAQDYTDADLPATAQPYRDVDHPTTRQAYEDVDLPTTPPDIPLVHIRARSTLSLIDEPTFPLNEEPTLPLTEESYLQRSALSPAQLSLARPEPAEQPGLTAVQGYTDVDQPTTPPADSSVHTPAPPTLPLTEDPLLQPSALSPAQLSPTQLAYTDVDLPATPPALSPVHTPVRSTLPLTEANLQRIDPDMAPAPSTPGKSTSTSKSGPENNNNVSEMQRILANRGYLINDPDAADQQEYFLSEIKTMVVGERHSAMAPASMEKVKLAYRNYKSCNEPTFLSHYLPPLLKEGRIPVTNEGEIQESKLWSEDRVAVILDQIFHSRCLPAIEAKDKLQQKLFDEIPKVPTPKPDFCYGFFTNGWCSADQHSVIQRFSGCTMVCPDMVLPWFVFEGKSASGSPAKALVQATRAGATLVAAFRALDEEAGTTPKGDGPDRRSIAFSFTITPVYASLNVHWADVKDGKVRNYHVHGLRQYLIEQSEQWADLRRDLHNVLDWGVLTRKRMIFEAVDEIVKRDLGLAEGAEKKGKGKEKGKKGTGKGGAEPEESASSSAPEGRRYSERLQNKK